MSENPGEESGLECIFYLDQSKMKLIYKDYIEEYSISKDFPTIKIIKRTNI